jgi:hypothetical protein
VWCVTYARRGPLTSLTRSHRQSHRNLTIYPYTVGHEDCKVLPRSFKTLAEAEAYLAEQDKGALEGGEFYLDGPEQDKATFDRTHNADGVRG